MLGMKYHIPITTKTDTNPPITIVNPAPTKDDTIPTSRVPKWFAPIAANE